VLKIKDFSDDFTHLVYRLLPMSLLP